MQTVTNFDIVVVGYFVLCCTMFALLLLLVCLSFKFRFVNFQLRIYCIYMYMYIVLLSQTTEPIWM